MNNIEYEHFISLLKEKTSEYFADEDNVSLFEQWNREEQNDATTNM